MDPDLVRQQAEEEARSGLAPPPPPAPAMERQAGEKKSVERRSVLSLLARWLGLR